MKINGNEIRPGNVIQHNGSLWAVAKLQHVKPGKGGAFAQVELKNLINGSKLNERFRSSETVERVRLEQNDYQFLYEADGMLVFMNTDSYEQIELQSDFVGERTAFLQDGMMVVVESQYAGHHRLPDGYGTNADARVMATLGHNLGFRARSVNRAARCQN